MRFINAALALAILTSAPSGLAQQGSHPGNQSSWLTPAAPKPHKKNTENPEFKAERLKAPIDLIDMPHYAGKKVTFVTGTVFPHVKGGSSATMEFSTADEPKMVLDWYKKTFQQYNWQPLNNMTGANGLAAMKLHNICQVMTLAPAKPGAKCDFLVRYKFYKADSFPGQ